MKLRRALSLLELLLALSITVLVAGAIAGMLGAISTGVGSKRDSRAVMVLASAAESRLSAYIAPSRCVLGLNGSSMILWFNDARQGGTVHATEIRWLEFTQKSGTLNVSYVQFPETWTQAACDLEDHEYAWGTDWNSVLSQYQASGWIASRPLVDEVSDVSISADDSDPLNCRHVGVTLSLQTEAGVVPVVVSSTIRLHSKPVK